jgi:hypothetical protein
MVTISISTAAFAAIASTFPKGSAADARLNGQGGYLFTRDRRFLDRLKSMLRRGETTRT